MKSGNFNPFTFSKKINRPLILDGSIGALLQKKGLADESPLWSTFTNEKFPEEVTKLHKQYIDAGADIITTNTFRTNPTAIILSGRKFSNKYVKNAVELARRSISDDSILVAGSNAPAEDCYQSKRSLIKKEIEENHKIHIKQLIKHGCHFVLNETQSHFDEIKFITDYCYEKKIPFIMSFLFDDKLRLLDGSSLTKAINYVLRKNPLAIGFNCITSEILLKALLKIKPDFNWGFYLNCSKGSITENIYSKGLSVSGYSEVIKTTLKYSPSFIGSCCGSTPTFTRQIRRIIDGSIKG